MRIGAGPNIPPLSLQEKMTMGVYEYSRVRITADECSDDILHLLCDTISDRLALRLGVDKLPETFERIAADASVKMFRRMYYEGITSESVQSINTAFVDDILKEYESEIESYIARQTGVVRFL